VLIFKLIFEIKYEITLKLLNIFVEK